MTKGIANAIEAGILVIVAHPWLFFPVLWFALVLPGTVVHAAFVRFAPGIPREERGLAKYLAHSLIIKGVALGLVTFMTAQDIDSLVGSFAHRLFSFPWIMALVPVYLITDPVYFILRNRDRKTNIVYWLHHPFAPILFGNCIWGVGWIMQLFLYMIDSFRPAAERSLW